MAGVDTFLMFNEGENFKLSEEGVFETCGCEEYQLLCGSHFFNPSVSFGIPKGWVKLNVDGSCLGNPGPASIGGLLRDASANWLSGFGLNIGEMSILNAEIIGISIGLQLAWSMGFRRVIVESDSLQAVRLINEKDISAHPLGHLIQDCRTLLSLDWCCSLSHVYRERNFSADSLAKQSHGLEIQELTIWDSPPWKVLPFLNNDKLGLGFRRH
uniref:RNase H type-1 domain-containing protein n=1 Tax=Manihot esculenta TaxID=3983 RepID=A0A2C9VZT4_MANES